jgi:hypothetical protein
MTDERVRGDFSRERKKELHPTRGHKRRNKWSSSCVLASAETRDCSPTIQESKRGSFSSSYYSAPRRHSQRASELGTRLQPFPGPWQSYEMRRPSPDLGSYGRTRYSRPNWISIPMRWLFGRENLRPGPTAGMLEPAVSLAV